MATPLDSTDRRVRAIVMDGVRRAYAPWTMEEDPDPICGRCDQRLSWHDGPNSECTFPRCDCPEFVAP